MQLAGDVRVQKATVAEFATALLLWLGLMGAGVLLDAPDLAGFASLTIAPLALLVGLRRDVPLKRKLLSVGLQWYVVPILLFVLWAVNSPGRILYFFVGTFCLLIFFLCFGCLVKFYWTERR